MAGSENHFRQKGDTYMKKRIIIADNLEEFCDQLVQSLKKHDMLEVVGIANDGEQAVRMIKQLKPDMLVLDLLLPKLDGIGVLKEINKVENRPVVVATSGFITDYVASTAANLGVRYLMLKPCDIDDLAEIMEEYWCGNEPRKASQKTTASKIETLTTNILRDIGVPAHIKGYHYLREAIMIAVEDPDVINALTKVLYPQVARTFQTAPARVARAIQHAIEISWDRRDQNGLGQFFGYTINVREDKPAVAEFLAVIVDDIQHTMRTP